MGCPHSIVLFLSWVITVRNLLYLKHSEVKCTNGYFTHINNYQHHHQVASSPASLRALERELSLGFTHCARFFSLGEKVEKEKRRLELGGGRDPQVWKLIRSEGKNIKYNPHEYNRRNPMKSDPPPKEYLILLQSKALNDKFRSFLPTEKIPWASFAEIPLHGRSDIMGLSYVLTHVHPWDTDSPFEEHICSFLLWSCEDPGFSVVYCFHRISLRKLLLEKLWEMKISKSNLLA